MIVPETTGRTTEKKVFKIYGLYSIEAKSCSERLSHEFSAPSFPESNLEATCILQAPGAKTKLAATLGVRSAAWVSNAAPLSGAVASSTLPLIALAVLETGMARNGGPSAEAQEQYKVRCLPEDEERHLIHTFAF